MTTKEFKEEKRRFKSEQDIEYILAYEFTYAAEVERNFQLTEKIANKGGCKVIEKY